MVIVSNLVFDLIAWFEFSVHIATTTVLVYRFMQFRRNNPQPSKNLKILWGLFLLFIGTLCFTAGVFSFKTFFDRSEFRRVISNTRYVFSQSWFFTFTAIQISLILILRNACYRVTKKRSKRTVGIRYLYLVPAVLFTFNFPRYCITNKSSKNFIYNTQILSNTGALICGFVAIFCCFWLFREFSDLKKVVSDNEYTARQNQKNNAIWWNFLIGNLVVGLLLVAFTIVDNIDDLFGLGILNRDVLEENVPKGCTNYCKARMTNSIIKFIYALVILLLSPQVKMRIKSSRVEQQIEAKTTEIDEENNGM